MSYLKSFGAVFAGLIVIFATSMITDLVLQNAGIIPKDNLYVASWLILIVIAYRIGFSIIGCFVTAWLSPTRPMRHALTLGVIGFLFSIMGAIVNAQQDLGPAWYPWTLVILTFPAAYAGGWLYERYSARA